MEQQYNSQSPELCIEPVLPNELITKEQVDIFIEKIENEIVLKKNDSENTES